MERKRTNKVLSARKEKRKSLLSFNKRERAIENHPGCLVRKTSRAQRWKEWNHPEDVLLRRIFGE